MLYLSANAVMSGIDAEKLIQDPNLEKEKRFTQEQIEAIANALNRDVDKLMPRLAMVLQQWDGLTKFKADTQKKLAEVG